MLSKGKINPLNVIEARRVEFCPPYFETVVINPSYNLNVAIDEWIYNHLSGRYFMGPSIEEATGTSSSGFKQKLKIGFENPSELSYFMLACPHLKY